MAFQVPSTWSLFSESSDGNTCTYTRPGHTVKEPRLALVSRVLASFDQKRGSWSVPSYRVRVFDGVLDATGHPDPTRTSIDATFRCSLNSDGAGRGDEATADFLLIVNQVDFVQAAFVTQAMPKVASV